MGGAKNSNTIRIFETGVRGCRISPFTLVISASVVSGHTAGSLVPMYVAFRDHHIYGFQSR